MKYLYLLSFIATLGVTAASDCVPLSNCPQENSKNYTVHVPYPYDCHKFYKCDRGCGILFVCPLAENYPTLRLVFNPEKQVCDWPENVPGACGGIVPPPTYPPPPPPVTQPPPPPPPVTYPPPPPPPVTYPPPPPPPVTYPPPPPPPVTYPPYPGVIITKCPVTGKRFILHEKYCHFYYECNGLKKMLRSCNENLIFNPYVEACDYPESIPCITLADLPKHVL